MKTVREHCTVVGQHLVTVACIATQLALGFVAVTPATSFAIPAAEPAAPADNSPAIHVNRSVPKVQPPRLDLRFSANPTAQEIFRARIFSEPLVPVGHEPSAAENRALAEALVAYSRRAVPDDFAALERFAQAHPDSAWMPALRFNLAREYYDTGWYSKCLAAWQDAWPSLRDAPGADAKALADRAVGELAYMYARLGRMVELQGLLDSVKDRSLVGSATERISGARQGLWTMQNWPGNAFKCGPLALDRILAAEDSTKAGNPVIREAKSTTNGCSLAEVAALSQKVGLNYQMAYRSAGAALLIPAVVNWKVGHYAALLKEDHGRYLLQDPTFRNDAWVSAKVLDQETSGYFLVPPGELPAGWRSVSEDEGGKVFGKGNTATSNPFRTLLKDLMTFFCGKEPMAVASASLMVVSLHIQDTPVSYRPPIGYPISFLAVYNQREASQPAIFSYSNLGPKWTFNWLAYINDNPSSPTADVNYYVDGGGTLPFTGFDSFSQTFAAQFDTQAVLTRTSADSYVMSFRDGSKIVFAQPDSFGGISRRVFMTQKIDPAGNSVQITYDDNLRVTAVTDAIGQVTTLTYGNANDPLKITRVTDPFGRFASFAYDSNNRLAQITDPIGIISQFQYDSGDFINTLITPYGTNTFEKGESGRTRWLNLTYADGGKERVEYNETTATGVSDEPLALVPTGMGLSDSYLVYRNTFYWDRKAYAEAPGNYSKAHIYHWLHQDTSETYSSGILESEKLPLENRVWQTYDGQGASYYVGTTAQPKAIGRVLDDGSSQVARFKYDSAGNVTNSVDPLGRSMSYVYASNLVDLVEVRQTTGTNHELVARASYNSQHLPLAFWNAAGQMTTNTYNARGQLIATTNPRNETTTFNYDPNGYLLSLDGPSPGTNDSTRFTYDAAGRVRTVTTLDGYTATNAYDNLDRLTNITFPDGTFTGFTYDKLDRVRVRDRQGRATVCTYDAVRRLTSVQDQLNRVTRFDYCNCGSLSALIDPLGRPTRWTYDLEGRVVSKQFVDGSHIQYGYESTSSRLKSVTDERGQTKSYTYGLDGNPIQISYANSEHPTPNVVLTYDTNYSRLLSMQDGIGTTSYSYYPAGVPGALQLAAVDGPSTNDTIVYQYDALNRITSRAINGVPQTYAFDTLGRMTNVVNVLGGFTYGYDGTTSRLLDSVYPNGQTTHYDYFDNLGNRRLQRITNRKPDTSLISQFTYAYNTVGQITNWVQALGVATNNWGIGYDAGDQLQSIHNDQGATSTDYTYNYDPAGNCLSGTVGATNRTFQYNSLNQLVWSSDNPLTNAACEWDAENRLTAITLGSNRSEFTYDGLGRRCRLIEKTNGVIESETHYLWCGLDLVEERNATDGVTRRFFSQGFTVGNTNYFYTRDHLGSTREVLDASAQVQTRYTYDAWGRQTKLAGSVDSLFGFAGYALHARSGLYLSLRRPYDPGTSRWLARDPLDTYGGVNLYGFVANNPLNEVDPYGACPDLAGKIFEKLGDWAEKAGEVLEYLDYARDKISSNVLWSMFNDPEVALDEIKYTAESVEQQAERWERYSTVLTSLAALPHLYDYWAHPDFANYLKVLVAGAQFIPVVDVSLDYGISMVDGLNNLVQTSPAAANALLDTVDFVNRVFTEDTPPDEGTRARFPELYYSDF